MIRLQKQHARPLYNRNIPAVTDRRIYRAYQRVQRHVGIAFVGLVACSIFTLGLASTYYRGYQDSWILEGIWLPLLALLVCYLWVFFQTPNLAYLASATAILVFTGYVAPGLKYSEIYSSTIDASVHYSMMRTLATTGMPDANAYEFTPGMHILTAALAQITGRSTIFWSKILPGLIGSLSPLGIYVLCRQSHLPTPLAKIIIALSGISLSLLYEPNGTTYAVAIISPLFTTMVIREVDLNKPSGGNPIAYGLLIVLIMATLLLWHAISSLLIPVSLIVSGISALFLWKFFAVFGAQFARLRISGFSLITTGIVGLYMLGMYWSLVAEPLWAHLIDNIRLFIEALTISDDVEPARKLVPSRVNEIPIWALLRIFLFVHARDGLLLGFALFGILFSFESIWRRRKEERPFLWLIFFCTVILISFSIIIIGTFVSGFSKHGYQRFIRYMIVASPVVAGYGMWRFIGMFNGWERFRVTNSLATAAVGLCYLIASIQLFPYQPATPTAQTIGGDDKTPLLWQHQVNTDYQQRMLEFGLRELDSSVNLFADYVTYQQSGLYLGLDAKKQVTYRRWTREQPAYVMLHHPGEAGVYMEQAEYRSAEEIARLRSIDGVSTVYDNGGSFILFVPEEQMFHYSLGND